MSASREKKLRQDLAAQGVTDPKLIREAEEKAKARKTNTLYGIIAALFVLVAAAVLVYNSGVLQRGKTAVVIEDHSGNDTVGLYDKVTVYLEDDDEEEVWQVVTTVRQDVLHGLISKESPMGAALMGKRVGDRFRVQVNKDYGYYAVVRAIEKGQDDGSAQLNRY